MVRSLSAVFRGSDSRMALGIFLFSWIVFAAVEQSPFQLQGAVVESLVERGRWYFSRGNMKGVMFENLDTETPSFRYLFNIFPYGGVYYVNHAPGQFLLAAPWYGALAKLGWRFETHERVVWRLLVWTLTAPLGALGVTCVFLLARRWGLSWPQALLSSMALALGSPWWAASGVLYHDSIAVALILAGTTLWVCRASYGGFAAVLAPAASGALLAYSVVTTYLVIPIVVLVAVFVAASRPPAREFALFGLGFLPVLAILPVVNTISFGSWWATGYSVGGFDENYPSPLNLWNAWEKIGFYIWHAEYGMIGLFPIFVVGALGVLIWRPDNPAVKKALWTLLAAHFFFIVMMEHHGSVGWGTGRFLLPAYPMLAFGVPAALKLPGWKGSASRALVFGSMLYSAIFAAAAVWYGLQGVMEPAVPSLKLRFMLSHYEVYRGIFLLALVVGVTGELAYHWLATARFQAAARMPSESVRLAKMKSRRVKQSRRRR